jgi:hypothetical protein
VLAESAGALVGLLFGLAAVAAVAVLVLGSLGRLADLGRGGWLGADLGRGGCIGADLGRSGRLGANLGRGGRLDVRVDFGVDGLSGGLGLGVSLGFGVSLGLGASLELAGGLRPGASLGSVAAVARLIVDLEPDLDALVLVLDGLGVDVPASVVAGGAGPESGGAVVGKVAVLDVEARIGLGADVALLL